MEEDMVSSSLAISKEVLEVGASDRTSDRVERWKGSGSSKRMSYVVDEPEQEEETLQTASVIHSTSQS